MTRLVAATLLAGLLASPAMATQNDAKVCVGGDDRNNTGRMIGFCIQNPFDDLHR
jgi:hypothetical protein